jgi:hypothetical protein
LQPHVTRCGKAQWLAPQVTVVISALNEAANLPYVLPRIPGWVHEVLIVDGESTDATPVLCDDANVRPELASRPWMTSGPVRCRATHHRIFVMLPFGIFPDYLARCEQSLPSTRVRRRETLCAMRYTG